MMKPRREPMKHPFRLEERLHEWMVIAGNGHHALAHSDRFGKFPILVLVHFKAVSLGIAACGVQKEAARRQQPPRVSLVAAGVTRRMAVPRPDRLGLVMK